jgi:hypothetical protein
VALPHRGGGGMRRIVRVFDSTVLDEVSEANVGSSVVLVFRTTHAGSAVLPFALTPGERRKALEAGTVRLVVR